MQLRRKADVAQFAGLIIVLDLPNPFDTGMHEAGPNQPGVRRGVAAYALDTARAARLWRTSVDMLVAAAAAK